MQTVGIVDYGMGNLHSVTNAFEHIGAVARVCRSPQELEAVDRIILPGVGAFGDAMRNLREGGWVVPLDHQVRQTGKPMLGICLGMQILACSGTEGGKHRGLGWIDADVLRIEPQGGLRVPHVGWNDIEYRSGHPLFADLPSRPDFYFVHSYAMRVERDEDLLAWCDYGGRICSAVGQGNIVATQFHPEKSQDYGLQMLMNFVDWMP